MTADVILPENGPVWQQLREGDLSGVNLERHSRMLVDCVKSMLNARPEMRPTCEALLSHPRLLL